ncbi:fatty acid desaturase [Ahrensia sp. R2A130]|uniref:fatty acid desaturase n=1 Tax=Ahrensia sp. R2A130 TaxID=744979 RepID=UPI0001E0AC7A|nr:fatty acid desaturase [Ahrensia sp. R2A130]EFL90703.1 fatty acid desaturase [Ahrensia sp. R2A130]
MLDEKLWSKRLAAYKLPRNGRALWELTATVVPYAAGIVTMYYALQVSVLLTLLLSIPTGAMLVRLFTIQHDCGHYAFFTSKKANDWVGRLLGVFTYTPFDDWRREHALHHAGSGNLDRRGFGDIDTLTVREYRALSKAGKWKYWLYRHPVVLFAIGPAYQFLLRQRLPTSKTANSMPVWSAMSTNVGIAIVSGLMIWAMGWQAFLLIQIPTVVVGGALGIWLFYVQHQYEETHWDFAEEWQREEAALHGSSFYDLPKWLMWLTGNIGIHHVHHISSRIPFHALPKVLKDFPELRDINRLTLLDSIKCMPLALWCEEQRKLISFRQARLQLALVRV